MINHNDDNDKKQSDVNKTNDDIDKLIIIAINDKGLDLMCPNRIDNEPCPAILRLTQKNKRGR